MKLRSIAIVGLGLMGASLAAACRKKFPQAKIVGISRNPKVIREARRKNWIHEGVLSIEDCLTAPDLVILCTPVDTFPRFFEAINQKRWNTVVTDVGSVKGEIERSVQRKRFKSLSFVGAHPMVGSHEWGIGAAKPDLFKQGYTFLVRSKFQDKKSFQKVRSFWKSLCPRVVEVTADRHDQIVASISHLPHAAACALVNAVPASALSFAASGFRDTTRIAQAHPSIWVPIFLANAKAVQKSLKNFEAKLKKFRSALARKDQSLLSRLLEEARRKRGEISL